MHGLRPGPWSPLLVLLALGLAGAGLAGCDSAEPPLSLEARPPVASGLTVTPGAVSLDTLDVGEGATVTLSLRVEADDPDGSVARVAYAVRWRFAESNDLAATGAFDAAGDGSYAAEVPVEVARDRRGEYAVSAFAVDADGLPSNEVQTTFTLLGTNLGPPVIGAVEAPAAVGRPSTFTLSVAPTDPDGPDDLARVELVTPGLGTIPLFDDGAGEDRDADDGRYTSPEFAIPEDALPGALPFTFRAFDRDGAAAEPVTFTVTVQ